MMHKKTKIAIEKAHKELTLLSKEEFESLIRNHKTGDIYNFLMELDEKEGLMMNKMILIAGPCVIENYDILKETVEGILNVIKDLDVDFYFKSSCIKDNRTKTYNYRGVGFLEGTRLMKKIKDEFKVKICTDFHNIDQIEEFGPHYDMIQIPAFLGRQVSLLEAAAEIASAHDKVVHYKKPQFMSPMDVDIPIHILHNKNARKIIITDRGMISGSKELVLDPRSIHTMKMRAPLGIKFLVDTTHPKKCYMDNTINQNMNAYLLSMSFLAAGTDGLFLEVRPNPKNALCDADTQMNLKNFKEFFEDFYSQFKFTESLREVRKVGNA